MTNPNNRRRQSLRRRKIAPPAAPPKPLNIAELSAAMAAWEISPTHPDGRPKSKRALQAERRARREAMMAGEGLPEVLRRPPLGPEVPQRLPSVSVTQEDAAALSAPLRRYRLPAVDVPGRPLWNRA